ncbi:MAG TPA: GAF domain-containing protein [Micromonosporaceae bacterium]|nr:GAF domain-containing protein [Micromonosporaceae bacterium]
MYRGSEERGGQGSALTAGNVRADLEARRISAEHWVRQAKEATNVARQMRDDLLKRRAEAEQRSASLLSESVRSAQNAARVRRLAFFDADFCVVSGRTAMLTALIDAALAMTRADYGNVQLLHGPSAELRIAAHRGFEAEFLDFFAVVHDEGSACGTAAARGQKVTVPDVANSSIFDGGPSGAVVLGAGVSAVHSIPLIGAGGRLSGVFSVHYTRPHRPDDNEERVLDLLAAAAVRRLDRSVDQHQLALVDAALPNWSLAPATSL